MTMMYVCKHCLVSDPPVVARIHLNKRLEHLESAHPELFEEIDETDEAASEAAKKKLLTESYTQADKYDKALGIERNEPPPPTEPPTETTTETPPTSLLGPVDPLDLPPGDWIVWFIDEHGATHNLTLDAVEKMVVHDKYMETLPSPSEFAYLAQTTFGIKDAVKLQRLIYVYDHFLKKYLQHKSGATQGDRPIGAFPQGSIRVGASPEEQQQAFLNFPGADPYGVAQPPGVPPQPSGFMFGTGPGYPSGSGYPSPLEPSTMRSVNPPQNNQPNFVDAITKAISQAMAPITERLTRLEGRNNGGERDSTPYRPLDRPTTLPFAARMVGTAPEEDPRIKALTEQITSLTANMNQLKDQQADDRRRKEEQEKRESLLRDINVSVTELVTRELGPLAAEVQSLKTIIPSNALANLGVTELIELNREIREGSIESRKLGLAEQKYRDDQAGAAAWRNEIGGSIKSIGSTIGEALGTTLQKNIAERGAEVAPQTHKPGGLIIPTQTAEGLVQFPCENCGRTVTADPKMPVATCLCGAKYQLSPQSQSPPTQAPVEAPATQEPASSVPETSGKITLVPPPESPPPLSESTTFTPNMPGPQMADI